VTASNETPILPDRAINGNVALGDGLPLLGGLPERQPLELVASTAWADGPITQTYIPRPERTD
jgi:hypothetical protein